MGTVALLDKVQKCCDLEYIDRGETSVGIMYENARLLPIITQLIEIIKKQDEVLSLFAVGASFGDFPTYISTDQLRDMALKPKLEVAAMLAKTLEKT